MSKKKTAKKAKRAVKAAPKSAPKAVKKAPKTTAKGKVTAPKKTVKKSTTKAAKKAPAQKPSAKKRTAKKSAAPKRATGFLDLFRKKKKPTPTPSPAAPQPTPKPAVKTPTASPQAAGTTPAGLVFIENRENRYWDQGMKTRIVPIYQRTDDRTAYFFRASMNVDADGAPKCYHPTNDSIALDDLENSTSHSREFIQGRNGIGPAPGYYVSQTSLTKGPTNRCDSFVDAVDIPYIVFPASFQDVKLGDVAMVYNTRNGQLTHAIFADTNKRVGEASVKTAHNLGFTSATPRNGIDEAVFIYLVFPGSKFAAANSAPHWPDTTIETVAEARFAAWGGLPKLQEIARKI